MKVTGFVFIMFSLLFIAHKSMGDESSMDELHNITVEINQTIVHYVEDGVGYVKFEADLFHKLMKQTQTVVLEKIDEVDSCIKRNLRTHEIAKSIMEDMTKTQQKLDRCNSI